MIKSNEEEKMYLELNKSRKIIKTRFSEMIEAYPKHIRSVSKKGLSVKLLLFTIAYNIKKLEKDYITNEYLNV
jgi:hypothetical protein